MSSTMIQLDNVTKSYPMAGGIPSRALNGLSLRIGAGEYVAVLGKSGSGKSTLLNLIAGLDKATSGTLRVADTDLTGLGENALSHWRGTHVGVVFQFFQLLPTLTALENIIIAMELVDRVPAAERRDRALALLQRVGLAEHAMKLPSSLSGGQQQRAAIARALANDPPLVLADEPTGNLDSETAADVGALFDELAREGKTLFIVTHDANLAACAHRIVSLKDGAVAADEMRAKAAA